MTAVLLGVVLYNGLGVFWPRPLEEITLSDGSKLLGDVVDTERNRETGSRNIKYRVANREVQSPFIWVDETAIASIAFPENAYLLDRVKDLQYMGFLKELVAPGLTLDEQAPLDVQLAEALRAVRAQRHRDVAPLEAEERAAARRLHRDVKYPLIRAKYERRQLLAGGLADDSAEVAAVDARIAALQARTGELNAQTDALRDRVTQQTGALRENVAVFVDAAGRQREMPLLDIVRFSRPNAMNLWDKTAYYAAKVWELVSDDPREANQDGGIFPAIFGTVLMVFLMAISCFPLGVLAGIYLGEYAKEGPLVKLVRIAVNNLAGIPSIVYGIFGLGFFIYLVGGQMDNWFYPDRVAESEPVFGQSSILWASLTLGLLTIPVVIVSTEEALRAIPRGVSESSYALGATKFQTLYRVLVPMASPGMMTGFILAMARAAGEVAPLMLTGAVKSAPLPIDSQFPFIRVEQKFMHLGYHILDISCKSPNVEATKPLVYVTTLLLLLIVLTLSSTAIYLRNRMQKRFHSRGI